MINFNKEPVNMDKNNLALIEKQINNIEDGSLEYVSTEEAHEIIKSLGGKRKPKSNDDAGTVNYYISLLIMRYLLKHYLEKRSK